MSLRNIIAVLAGCIFSLSVHAQSDKPPAAARKGCSCTFSSINQLSILSGQVNNSVGLQTINGLWYKGWFGGLGVGLDFYKIKSMPVFLDIRKNILSKANTPFVYAEGGLHFPVGNNIKDGWYVSQKFEKGSFYEFGAGYAIPVIRKQAIVLSVGYSAKAYTERRVSNVFCIWQCSGTLNEDVYNYRLNRAVVKVGWKF